MEADLAEAREVHLAFNTVKAKMQLKSAEADHMLITCAMVDGTRNGKHLHSELENHHAING